MKLQVVSKHTETCELCAWIHCVFTRPDASQKLRGKLERFTRKKGFSSPNHRLSGHGNSGCARLALLNTYHRINWTFREGKPHLSKVYCWADQNAALHVWNPQPRSQEVLNIYIPQEKSSSFGLCDKKPAVFVTPLIPRVVCLSLWRKSKSCVYLPQEEQAQVMLQTTQKIMCILHTSHTNVSRAGRKN